MTSSTPKKLVVVGAGPGGYEAALTGAKAGLDVTLGERGKLGGTCLNWGCIPTKHLLAATSPVHALEAQAKQKLVAGEVKPDLAAIQQKKRRLIAATQKAMAETLKKAGVRLITGNLTAVAPGTAQVMQVGQSTIIPFDSLILALGSRAAGFPGVKPDG